MGFSLHRQFKDGSVTEEAVKAQRKGDQVIVTPMIPSPSGDYWIVDDRSGLILMDSEGEIGTARKIP